MLSGIIFLIIVALSALVLAGSLYVCTKLTKLMFVAVFNEVSRLVRMPSLIAASIMSFCQNLKSSLGSFKSIFKDKARKVKSILIFTSPKKPKADETPGPVLVRHEALWKEDKNWSLYDEPAWIRHGRHLAFK